jgi:hypothetical protein
VSLCPYDIRVELNLKHLTGARRGTDGSEGQRSEVSQGPGSGVANGPNELWTGPRLLCHDCMVRLSLPPAGFAAFDSTTPVVLMSPILSQAWDLLRLCSSSSF